MKSNISERTFDFVRRMVELSLVLEKKSGTSLIIANQFSNFNIGAAWYGE